MWLGPDHRARSTFTYTWPGSIGNDTRALTMLRSAAGRSCPAHGPAVWAATIEPPACDTPCNRSQPGNNRRAQGVLKAHVDKLSLALRQAATLGGDQGCRYKNDATMAGSNPRSAKGGSRWFNEHGFRQFDAMPL
jgi:hypothetical protein